VNRVASESSVRGGLPYVKVPIQVPPSGNSVKWRCLVSSQTKPGRSRAMDMTEVSIVHLIE